MKPYSLVIGTTMVDIFGYSPTHKNIDVVVEKFKFPLVV